MSDQGPFRQEQAVRAGRIAFILFLVIAGLGLTGCGKKPSHIDPPLGTEEDTFPRTYPDLKTDPQPDLDARPDLAPKKTAPPPKSF